MDNSNIFSATNRYQNIVVMRHGDRIDDVQESWLMNADRPWDPPLVDAGRGRAFRTGVELRTQLGFPIHRVFASPFLRCVQTASEVVSALSAIDEDNYDATPKTTDMLADSPKIKASVEYGICEIMNDMSVKIPPEDGNWGFNRSELQLKLPAGTVDSKHEPVVNELPEWGEMRSNGIARFASVIQTLADKYPSENLLLVTHGEGLRATVYTFSNGLRLRNIEYCARVELQRQVTMKVDNGSYIAGKFSIASHRGGDLIPL